MEVAAFRNAFPSGLNSSTCEGSFLLANVPPTICLPAFGMISATGDTTSLASAAGQDT